MSSDQDSPDEGDRASYYRRFWDIPYMFPGFRLADHSYIAMYGVRRLAVYGVQKVGSVLWRGLPLRLLLPPGMKMEATGPCCG